MEHLEVFDVVTLLKDSPSRVLQLTEGGMSFLWALREWL